MASFWIHYILLGGIISVLSTAGALEENSTVCESVHISHSIDELRAIIKCDVINGNLILDNIEVSSDEWKRYRSPVREVTGFVLLYAVSNLTSLDIVLPKLRVIRGHELVHENYALAISKLPDLRALNLHELTVIKNGGVFIEGCHRLNSYTRNIEWTLITAQNVTNNIEIREIQPGRCNSTCRDNHCWSANVCQESCPVSCGISGCSPSGMCCHPLCLGGCSEPDQFDKCYSCKGYRSNDGCRDTCRNYYYEWDDFTCVWQGECKKKGRYLFREKNKCLDECPQRYTPNSERVCIQTNSSLECGGGDVNSIEDSLSFAGCTSVNGSLFIRITEKDSTAALKEAFGKISRVSGMLYIFETTLETLAFLENITFIGGEELHDEKYSLVVRDCPHLHSLWRSHTSLMLKNGAALLYHNPLLCPGNIQSLISASYMEEALQSSDTRSLFNGYRAVCDVKTMKVESRALFRRGVIELEFPSPEDSVRRRMSGYMIYYTKSPEGTFYKGKEDIDSKWDLDFVEYQNEGGNIFKVFLQGLEPATRYAIFVSLSATQSNLVYQSQEIIYQSTKPFNPGRPSRLIQEYRPNSISLSWSNPHNQYGSIDYFLVTINPINSHTLVSSRGTGNLAQEDYGHTEIDKASAITTNGELQSNSLEKLTPPEIEDVLDTFSHLVLHTNPPDLAKRRRRALTRDDSDSDVDYDLPPSAFSSGFTWSRNSKSQPEIDLHRFISQDPQLNTDVFRNSYHDPKAALDKINELIDMTSRIGHMDDRTELIFQRKHVDHLLDYMDSTEDDEFIQMKSTLGMKPDSPEPIIHRKHGGNLMEFEVAGNNLVLTREATEKYAEQNFVYGIEMRACHKILDECPEGELPPCSFCSLSHLTDKVCLISEGLDLKVNQLEVTAINDTFVDVSWKTPQLAYNLIRSYNIKIELISQDGNAELIQQLCVIPPMTSRISDAIPLPGKYQVTVLTEIFCTNASHVQKKSAPVFFEILVDHYWESVSAHICLSASFLLVVVLLYCIIIIWIPNKLDKIDKVLGIHTCNNSNYDFLHIHNQLEQLIPNAWRHDPKNLTLGQKIGEGNFGKVFRGFLIVDKQELPVAAKVLKHADHLDKDLINEANLMMNVRSHHLVRTHGITFKNSQMYLLMEFMDNGTLQSFLRCRRRGDFEKSSHGTSEKLLHFALQVADGMLYLESQRIIHRDLAARNCLLDSSYNVKISDFGLSRFTQTGGYAMTRAYAVPVRRMPPEYFLEEPYTSKSDVWLYGILLWEIVTECCCPLYEGLQDITVGEAVRDGFTLENSLPALTPKHFRRTMLNCWKRDPSQRQCFKEIISYFLSHANDRRFILYFWNSSFHFADQSLEEEFRSPSKLKENSSGITDKFVYNSDIN